ncbi:MAG: FAD-dependent oxidoreductase [Crocinitomicaceae bacterium]|nr:FAD-dependent oxidoreductase [Crocinitomicaceae bacterium]
MKNIIVGGGIAGISIAFELLKRKEEIIIIDKKTNTASEVAGGIINPIVFRRTTKSWRIDEMLPKAINFYKQLEVLIHQQLISPITIRRFFSSEQESDTWVKKQKKEGFKDYLAELTEEDSLFSEVKNEFGSGRVKNAYWINTKKLIEETHAFLKKENIYKNESFEYNDLDVNKKKYKNIPFNRIFFCEGHQVKKNPFFNQLPISWTKGQLLTIRSQNLYNKTLLNRKCFVLPREKDVFLLGATYEWNATNYKTTIEAESELLEKFNYISDEKPEIICQEAGIRPTTPDRRPFIGCHPTHKNLLIFNGLGAKGYLIAPLLSKELIESILENKTLSSETSIHRKVKH